MQKPIPENTPEKLKNHIPVLGDKGIFIEDLYADKAIDFMGKNKDKPFFIYYASVVPHGDKHSIPYSGLWAPNLEGYDQLDLTDREQINLGG